MIINRSRLTLIGTLLSIVLASCASTPSNIRFAGRSLVMQGLSELDLHFALFPYPVTEPELLWYCEKLAPMEAWIRSHPREVRGVFNPHQAGEAIRLLDIWDDLQIDRIAFNSVTSKLLGMSRIEVWQWAMPKFKADLHLHRTALKREKFLTGKQQYHQREILRLQNRLTQILDFPVEKRAFFTRHQGQIRRALKHYPDFHGYAPIPPEAIHLPEWGVQVFASGTWKQIPTRDNWSRVFELPALHCTLQFGPMPSPNYTPPETPGSVLRVHNLLIRDTFWTFIFRAPAAKWGLARPIYEEIVGHLRIEYVEPATGIILTF
jgi:hypothetical protein